MGGPGLPALERIYETYHDKVFSYAAKLIGRDDADDVTQEVFIKVGRSLEGLNDPARLTSWIYSITLNAVRDTARKRSVALRHVAPAPDSCGGETEVDGGLDRFPDARSATPEDDAMRNQMVTCYLDYVEALPANYYDVYVLSELLELPNEEIARRLSLTLATVKIRLHRARAQLHEQLRRDCQCFTTDRGELLGHPRAGVAPRCARPTARKRSRAGS